MTKGDATMARSSRTCTDHREPCQREVVSKQSHLGWQPILFTIY